jgi:hypothetical protein
MASPLPFFKAMLGRLFCIMSLSAARAAVAERVCQVLLLFGGIWAEVPDAPFNGGFNMTLFPVLFCLFLCALLLLMEMYEGLLYDYSLYLATAFSGKGFWPLRWQLPKKEVLWSSFKAEKPISLGYPCLVSVPAVHSISA